MPDFIRGKAGVQRAQQLSRTDHSEEGKTIHLLRLHRSTMTYWGLLIAEEESKRDLKRTSDLRYCRREAQLLHSRHSL